MLFDTILERNRSFVAAREPRALPPPEQTPLAIVACYDPRLDALLLPALGLQPGQAFLLRTAGALVQPSGSAMRSLGLAIFMFGVNEVIVVGHSSCRMAAFESAAFIEMFRRRGVARESFGPSDLRDWAGAIPSPRHGVQLSVENVRAAPFLPRDVAVSGLVLDDTTGALEIVARGELRASQREARAGTEAEQPAPAGAEAAKSGPPAAVAVKIATAAAAALKPALEEPQGARASSGREDLEEALLPAHFEKLLEVLESKMYWRKAAQDLRQELALEPSAAARASLLEGLARRAAADSREVAGALKEFQDSVRGGVQPPRPASRPISTPLRKR